MECETYYILLDLKNNCVKHKKSIENIITVDKLSDKIITDQIKWLDNQINKLSECMEEMIKSSIPF